MNLEYLARVVFTAPTAPSRAPLAYPDTLVGTDSHTTMINGLGVLGWGVGGIEAEAAMLGQPVSMLVPQVVGFKLTGTLREGATATDLVLTVTEMLRKKGVVGKFVEYYGDGLAGLPLADRATIANMAPEYGATCGIFPIDAETLRYLELSGRPGERSAWSRPTAEAQGMFHAPEPPEADLLRHPRARPVDRRAEPGRPEAAAGPRPLQRRQDVVSRRPCKRCSARPADEEPQTKPARWPSEAAARRVEWRSASPPAHGHAREQGLTHGSVVIAAITSCTNTSNPSVMLAAGLLAKKAVEKGLATKPWVKASLAPGRRW